MRHIALVLALTLAPVTATAGEVDDKATVAQAVNRALDMAQSAVGGASAEVRKVAPHAWAAVVRQVRIEGMWEMVGMLVLGAGLAAFAAWAIRRAIRLEDTNTSP